MYSRKLFTAGLSSRFKHVFSHATPEGVELLMKVLVYRPQKRYRARDVMAHQFYDSLRSPDFTVTSRTTATKLKIANMLFNFSDYELSTLGPLTGKLLPSK